MRTYGLFFCYLYKKDEEDTLIKVAIAKTSSATLTRDLKGLLDKSTSYRVI